MMYNGSVAQMVELAAHNCLVFGSSPDGATTGQPELDYRRAM